MVSGKVMSRHIAHTCEPKKNRGGDSRIFGVHSVETTGDLKGESCEKSIYGENPFSLKMGRIYIFHSEFLDFCCK
jgi:hypothetical protein